ncbi:MAG: rRNA pseudouridine synthase [Lachnospiraceae bacterium]|nr:rRNA pseudouridine synthase [Lachnospiraceae bacterium]
MRLDKLLCELNIGTRSEVKNYLKKGLISVNGVLVKKPEEKVDETTCVITYKGKEYRYRPFVYFMMNKPAGVITATKDDHDETVMDLFALQLKREKTDGPDSAFSGFKISELFPVGRLDKDTVGLLLITNDGDLAHRLLSPQKHVPKTYYVETDLPLNRNHKESLEQGVNIGEKNITKEASLMILGEKSCHITITEGKFHQVKRMFQAVGLTVTYLKRISMGSLCLDESLEEGCVRPLTQSEVDKLC